MAGLGKGKMLKYRTLVLVLTFASYASFHMSRKAPSIVKGALHPHVESKGGKSVRSQEEWGPVLNPGWNPFADDLDPSIVSKHGFDVSLSRSCEINSNYGAGTYTCKGNHFSVVNENGVNVTFCSHYTSSGDGGKFNLKMIESHDSSRAQQLCTHFGAKNGTRGCWLISANFNKLSAKERKSFCVGKDCAIYIQPTGHLIPAPADDKIGWIESNTDLERGSVNVVPHGITNGKVLLGMCDTVYLAFYALGMFATGHLADHVPANIVLCIGMIGSGIFVSLIGFAYSFQVHSMAYFYAIYAVQGIFQSMGWPAVVAVMGNWFPKSTRGLVMGIWNSHTSVGNILGSVISGAALTMGMNDNDWPAAFWLSGAIIAAVGIVVAIALPNRPEEVGLSLESEERLISADESLVYQSIHPEDNAKKERERAKGCSLCRALRIPGVLEFSISLFFAKFVAYMFIYWLPYYLGHLKFSTDAAANLSTAFDAGGIIGGIFAGWVSDKLRRRAPVAFIYLVLSIPALYFFREISAAVGDSSIIISVIIMLVCGAFVNGPYALITTAVSADLGSHESLKGDQSLTATVTGVIDGTGSIGASIQGVVIGIIASGCTAKGQSWDSVFDLLIICCCMSAICLLRLVLKQGPSESSCGATVYKVGTLLIMAAMLVVGIVLFMSLTASCSPSILCNRA